MSVSRWRGRGWLAEIRQRDLALTLPQTAELFTALGEHRLAASEIDGAAASPVEQQAGWPAWPAWPPRRVQGLRRRPGRWPGRSSPGRTPVVADLLARRAAPRRHSPGAVGVLAADLGRLLLDAELCDALSGRSDSGEVLRRMEADLHF